MPLSEQAERRKDRRTGTSAAPQLQHRHFAFIASVVRAIPTPAARNEATNAFLGNLKGSNPNFDSCRFRSACNGEPSEFTLEELDLAVAHATFWLEHLKKERIARGTECSRCGLLNGHRYPCVA